MKSYELGRPPGQQRLLEALALTPPRLDLAALAIARLRGVPIDDGAVLRELDRLADRVRVRVSHGRLEALRSVLCDEEGFVGDQLTYHAPENSYLDQVMARRKGLPITLTVLFIEVGRRAGVDVRGVGLPGHFVARLDGEFFDPFHQARRLTLDECRALVAKTGAPFEEKLLAPVPTRAICWRMLSNLKNGWLELREPAQVLPVVELLLALSPKNPAELRVRAAALIELGAIPAAMQDLRTCLSLQPDAPDAEALKRRLKALEPRAAVLH